jgi:hypothetical protein
MKRLVRDVPSALGEREAVGRAEKKGTEIAGQMGAVVEPASPSS